MWGPETVDVAVIGRGLMGTACARHLAEGGARVALIGPDEPVDRQSHNGPFGSFHDEGRITRGLATDPDWSLLSTRSIARYADIETRSGVPFFTPCGAMLAGPAGARFTSDFLSVAADCDLPSTRLDTSDLARRFPYLSFAEGTLGLWEAGGGVINPRKLRVAEERLAVMSGADVIRKTATALTGTDVTCADGSMTRAGHVVVATGGYAYTDGLLPARPVLDPLARTIAFAAVTEAEAKTLADMPSMIWMPQDIDHDLYMLPPIRYPDGRLWIKIGGYEVSPTLGTDMDMIEWFRSDGRPEIATRLMGCLRDVLPGLSVPATSAGACVVTYTATGQPYIDRLDDRLTLLTGGNGAAAKNCDEIGRLGAIVACGGSLANEGYRADFRAVLA